MSYSKKSSKSSKKSATPNQTPVPTIPKSTKPPELFVCGKCKQKASTKSGQYCSKCKPQHHLLQTGAQPARAVAQWLPDPVSQDARATLQYAKNPYLKDHALYASHIFKHFKIYGNSNTSSGFGDQDTLWEEGTVSVDFQGIREGSSDTIWLDYQGQAGKGSARVSHWQVMIVCGSGVPSQALIEAAIDASHGEAARSLLLTNNTQGRPK
ncbi:hypothetical protein GXW71_09010 [Roseomonas hellenica]|uniref:Uncharacterized protein n=1 Tax=Plastoroseomonas hellenica TaxID=2687306 RepID=A0ABS5EW07_9PROT|nr:hypothetical protein [Plastoroseomonas hellenica]MBR0664490.1 hypothetical protein [Plastoroseomonas hellenica]